MINLITEIKEKIEKLEEMLIANEAKRSITTDCTAQLKLECVDLYNGTTEDKIERIIQQIQQYNINILPTANDSQLVRSAIIAEFGEIGQQYWIAIRRYREDFDEASQIKKYNYQLKSRAKNTMTFGTIVNRYRNAINLYNETNSIKTN